MKDGLVMLVIIMTLKDTRTFQVLFIVSLFCAWNIPWRSTVAFTYLKVKSDKCLSLVLVVLLVLVLVLFSVLRIWFCLHH